MRDIRLSRLISLILIVATLIFFISCGIPFFINFDEDIKIPLNYVKQTDKEIEFKVEISNKGISKINDPEYDFTTNPSLKFFYVLANESGRTSYLPPNVEYRVDDVKSIFKSNYKGSTGNGYPFIVPTFYSYTNREGKTKNFARSRQLLKNWDSSKEEGILVGTFFNETVGQFNGAPKMDYLLDVIGSQDLLLKLEDNKVKLYKNNNIVEEATFSAFNKQPFPSDGDSLNDFINKSNESNNTDQVFLNPLKGSSTLYLHLWVAAYGGEGSFTNIYWSDLTYLGSFDLYK